MLGIIDWGIGGVSIYKLAKEKLGDLPIVYLSDTGATPYGRMSRSELVARLDLAIDLLRANGVTHLIIGCNAASTAIPFLRDHEIEMVGMIEPAVGMTAQLRPKRLGLIGGRRTVLSGAYRRAFARYGLKVEQRIAQPLSALIEGGDIASGKLTAEAQRILAPIRNSSHILMACTHYPAVEPVLRTIVSSHTKLIDPASEIIDIASIWKLERSGTDQFLTTGNREAMVRAAKKAFGVLIDQPSSVTF